jgi:hypothetical protein
MRSSTTGAAGCCGAGLVALKNSRSSASGPTIKNEVLGWMVLRIANNQDEATLIADLKMADATGQYALESLEHPRWLAAHWKSLLPKLVRKARQTDALFEKRFPGRAT